VTVAIEVISCLDELLPEVGLVSQSQPVGPAEGLRLRFDAFLREGRRAHAGRVGGRLLQELRQPLDSDVLEGLLGELLDALHLAGVGLRPLHDLARNGRRVVGRRVAAREEAVDRAEATGGVPVGRRLQPNRETANLRLRPEGPAHVHRVPDKRPVAPQLNGLARGEGQKKRLERLHGGPEKRPTLLLDHRKDLIPV
jgi:hypothetical protein